MFLTENGTACMQCSASISLTRVVWNAITLSPSLALNAKCVENRARRFSHASLLFILDFYYLAMQSINDFKCKLCEIWKHSHTHTPNLIQTLENIEMKASSRQALCSRARLIIDRVLLFMVCAMKFEPTNNNNNNNTNHRRKKKYNLSQQL